MHSKISAVVALLHITDTSRLLEVLKDDSKAIFSAASLATRAVDFLIGLQPKPDPAPDPDVASEANAAPRRPDEAAPRDGSPERLGGLRS